MTGGRRERCGRKPSVAAKDNVKDWKSYKRKQLDAKKNVKNIKDIGTFYKVKEATKSMPV